ncbi:DUF4350 domain-containing protein [Halogeometricum borinquense]|uniref:DUF4350 domain-containing protein n=1 Tax=Halogeometricum borinquense TaxID=60847 RepID=UPI00343003B6
MRRRTFLATLAAASISGTASAASDTATQNATTIADLAFDSTNSLLDASQEQLTDNSVIAVWAEDSASITDADENGDAVSYPQTSIPLVGVDGSVAGFGTMLVDDDQDFSTGNEEFILNVWDDLADGGTVLWDEGHGQYYTLARFSAFETYAESNGYDVQATSDLTADLSGTSAVVITSPSDAFSDAELSALSSFVAEGGAVFLHHQSDFDDFDETDNLNTIASELGLSFRFNDAQVTDATNNTGVNYVPTTSQFNDGFPYFEDRDGISSGSELDPSKRYTVDVISVADGDTFDVEFDDGTEESIRVLGIDTPESASASDAERPEEWEGLSYEETTDGVRSVSTLNFYSATTLLAADGSPYTDGETTAVLAPEGSAVNDEDGNGDAVTYPDSAIPLAAIDGNVAAVSSALVNDASLDSDASNFVLNVWDDLTGGDATVAWYDNGQFDGFDSFSNFVSNAESAGYTVSTVDSLDVDLSGVDLVVCSQPQQPSDTELSALTTFVEDGGAVYAMGKSDYEDYDNTTASNDILDAAGAPFRFNDAQVVDSEGNFEFSTSRFDSSFPYFGGGEDNSSSDVQYPYLVNWANQATSVAEEELSGKTIEIYFDENEGVRDPFDRVLAYADYDATGDGNRDTTYNAKMIEDGLARVYGSTLSRHDEFWDLEHTARTEGRGLWNESDISTAAEIRNSTVQELYFPDAAAVTGPASLDGRVPVASEDGTPLVGVDADAGIALVGSPFIDESYEADEGFAADTSGYGNFAFLSNLIDFLSDKNGNVLIDGGHGQFGAGYALSAEDAAYYQRYLEGVGLNLEQVNTAYSERLDDARAIIVTTPVSEFTDDEVAALSDFAANDGAVVLLGSAAAPGSTTANLERLASELGTDLRLGSAVTDGSSNVNGNASIPVTTNFDDAFSLFDSYEPNTGGSGGSDGDDGESPTLSVSFPENGGVGGTVPAELSLSDAPDGLAGFDVTVSVDDAAVASVESATVADAFPSGVTEVSVADDGSSVTLAASDIEDAVEGGAANVSLATLSVGLQSAGETGVTLTVNALDSDADGSAIDAATDTGVVTVADIARIGDNDLPTDPDGDGLYEDMNGNGEADFEDVVVFFEHRDSDAVQSNADSFDFNGNGRVDFDDINTLFDEI